MQNAYARSPEILGAIRPASSWLSLPQIRVATAAALVLGLTLWVYWNTLSPTINSFDSAELITGAYALGIVHAPGYPLYLLLGHLATRLPWGSIAYNVNLMSAVFGSLAAVVIFYASWRLSRALWSSAIAALILAFSRMFWSEAVVAEVYTLNALLVGGVILAAILLYENPGSKTLIALATTFGLSLTNHPSALLLGPGLVALVLYRVRGQGIRGKTWVAALFGLSAPLLLYLYLPLRYVADPALNYVGDYFDVNLASVEGLIWMVSGRMFSQELFGRTVVEGLGQILSLGLGIWLNFIGAGLVLALYGLARLRTRKALAFFLGGSAVAILLLFAFYDVVDNAQMLLPALVLLTPPLACGLDRFMRRARARLALNGRFQPVLAGVLALLAASLLIAANWKFADRSGDWSAYDFAQEVMAEVEPGALILAQWTSATPLDYVQIVEGSRPDLDILDRGLMALGIRDKLNRQGIASQVDANRLSLAALTDQVSRELLERPVYIMENDPVLRGSFCYEKQKIDIYRLFPWETAPQTCLGQLSTGSAYIGLGESLFWRGDYAGAANAYRQAIEDPTVRAEAYKGLAWANFNLGEYDLAELSFQDSIRFGIQPSLRLADSYNGIGWVLQRQGECELAISYFEKSLELSPTFPDAQRGIEICQNLIKQDKDPASLKSIPPQIARIARIYEQATPGFRIS